MKILFDHQIFTLQNFGGISRYYCELISQLSNDSSYHVSLALRYSKNENLSSCPKTNLAWSKKSLFNSHPRLGLFTEKILSSNFLQLAYNNSYYPFNQKESERLLKKQEFDIFHPTYYNPYFLPKIKKKPFILTVYDMIHERFPDYFQDNDPTKFWKNKLIRSANEIIAISENTKNDIIRYSHINPEKVHVVYLGNPFERIPKKQEKLDFPSDLRNNTRYLLFVGIRSGYKNFLFCINALAPLIQKEDNLLIYCLGGGPFTSTETDAINRLNLTKKVFQLQPDERIIRFFYENASAFIFPSLYEGFGLPVLEAFSCGCPIVMSHSSSLPEIGKDAALYFDPQSPVSLREAVSLIISDSGLRHSLIKKGYDRLKFFSWQKNALETKEIYESLGL